MSEQAKKSTAIIGGVCALVIASGLIAYPNGLWAKILAAVLIVAVLGSEIIYLKRRKHPQAPG